MATLGQILFLDGGIPSRLSSNANADISGNLDLSGSLWVKSDLDVSGTVDVSGAVLLRGDLDVSGTLSVVGLADFSGATFSSDISGTAAHFSGSLDASAALIKNDLDVSGALSVAGASDFSGAISAKDISGSNLDLSGTLSVAGLADFSGATFSADLSGQNAYFAQDVQIAGNLTVQGTTTSAQSQDVLLADRFITQNYTLTLPAAGFQTAGDVYVVKALGSEFAVTAANGSTETFTVTANPTGIIAAGDIIAVAGMQQEKNNGLFQVASITTSSITVTAAPAAVLEGIVNTVALETESGASGKLAHVRIKVLRADADNSTFSLGSGDACGNMVFDEITPADAITLQQAYDNGNEIITAAGVPIQFTLTDGNFQVDGAVAGGMSVQFGPTTPIADFYVNTSDLISLYTQGSSTLSSAQQNSITSGAAQVDAIFIAATAGGIDLNAASDTTIDASGQIQVTANSGTYDAIVLDASGVGSGMVLRTDSWLGIYAGNPTYTDGGMNLYAGSNKLDIWSKADFELKSANYTSSNIKNDILMKTTSIGPKRISLSSEDVYSGDFSYLNLYASGKASLGSYSTTGEGLNLYSRNAMVLYAYNGTILIQAQENNGVQLSRAGMDITVQAAETIPKCAIVAITGYANGYAQIEKARSGGTDLQRQVFGVSKRGMVMNTGDTDYIYTVPGTEVVALTAGSITTADAGKPVYLNGTGLVSLTPPSAAGQAVIRVGYVTRGFTNFGLSGPGVYMMWAPQFIAQIPA